MNWLRRIWRWFRPLRKEPTFNDLVTGEALKILEENMSFKCAVAREYGEAPTLTIKRPPRAVIHYEPAVRIEWNDHG